MGPALKALKGRRREFALLVAKGELSLQECAQKAKYAHSSAHVTATRLLKDAKVLAAIDELKQAAVDDCVMTRTRALTKLTEIADTGSNEQVQIKAIDSLSKMQGWNAPDKVENTHEFIDPPQINFVTREAEDES